jgi:hypothetical protein
VVVEDVIVPPNIKLEIQAGTEVRFNQLRGLNVLEGGKLIIAGQENDSVYLVPNYTGNQEWFWRGITVNGTPEQDPLVVEHAHFFRASKGLECQFSENMVINHNRFYHNYTGLSLISPSNVEVKYNIFEKSISDNMSVLNFTNGSNNNIYQGNIVKEGFYGMTFSDLGGSGNAVITENIFIGNGNDGDGFGLQINMNSVTVINNIFWNNEIAVGYNGVADGSFTKNNLYQNKFGMVVNNATSSLSISENTFTGGSNNAFVVSSGESFEIKNNNIFNYSSDTAVVKNLSGANLNFESTYWGTTDTETIDGWIIDNKDDPMLGLITYEPVNTEPNIDAPVSAPVNFIAQQINGTVKFSWNKNPEPDILGYQIYFGSFNHYSFSDSTQLITDTVFYSSEINMDGRIAIRAIDNNIPILKSRISEHYSPFAFVVPMPFAGEDSIVCSSIPEFQISKSTIPFEYLSVQWTTDGDGSFSDPSAIQPAYSFGENDKINGAVNLTMSVITADSTFFDEMAITLLSAPQVFAGEDGVIAPDSIFITTGATAQFTDEIQWVSTGDGFFDDSSALVTSYNPGPGDISSGFVQLILSGANASCEPDSDTLNLYIRNYFSVEGQVNMGNSKSINTPVIALGISSPEGDPSDLVAHTDEEGRFRFEKLFTGTYMLYALPDTSGNHNFLPAYHPNKTVWQEGYVLEIPGEVYEIDITLPQIEAPLPAGQGTITGQFQYPAEYDQIMGTYCQPWFISSSETFCDGGMTNATIYLYGESESRIYDFTLTGPDGSFKFDNLPFGNYILKAEIVGYESVSSGLITLTPASPDFSGVTLSIRSEKKVSINLPEENRPWFNHLIYPIPAKDMIYIESRKLPESGDWTIDIRDLSGLTVKRTSISGNKSKFQVDVRDLPSGFYLIIVTNSQYSFRKKIVISR